MALIEIAPTTTMEEVLRAYLSAKVGLFQRYYIGTRETRSIGGECRAVASSLARGLAGLIVLAVIALSAFVSIGDPDPSGASGGSAGRAGTVLPAAEASREEQEMTLIGIVPTTTMEDVPRAYPSANVALLQRYHVGGCESRSHTPTEMLVELHHNWMRE